MIALAGATGLLGSRIAARLLGSGVRVRVLVRNEEARRRFAERGAEAVLGDLKDPASLRAFCEGAEAVVTTANSVQRGGADTLESVDVEGNRALVAAAKDAGVRRFVFVSALGASPESPLPLMRAKGLAEDALRSSGLAWTVLQPNLFMEVWIDHVVALPVRTARPVSLVGEGRKRHAFVSVDDVAAFAATAATSDTARDRTLAFGGPEAVSWREVVSRSEKIVGRPIWVSWLEPGSPLPHFPEPIATRLGLLMTGLEQRETAFDSSALYREMGVTPKPLDAVLAELLATSPRAT